MQALLVGADRLGNIPEVLGEFGIERFRHVSGRDRSHQRKAAALPTGTQLVILFTDFLGHNVMQSFRDAAREEGVPVVCCPRSVCRLRRALSQHRGAGEACGACPRGR